jgi:hypothetical protein
MDIIYLGDVAALQLSLQTLKMDIIYLGDVAALQLSLQTLKAFSGDELYRYYRLVLPHQSRSTDEWYRYRVHLDTGAKASKTSHSGE